MTRFLVNVFYIVRVLVLICSILCHFSMEKIQWTRRLHVVTSSELEISILDLKYCKNLKYTEWVGVSYVICKTLRKDKEKNSGNPLTPVQSIKSLL